MPKSGLPFIKTEKKSLEKMHPQKYGPFSRKMQTSCRKSWLDLKTRIKKLPFQTIKTKYLSWQLTSAILDEAEWLKNDISRTILQGCTKIICYPCFTVIWTHGVKIYASEINLPT